MKLYFNPQSRALIAKWMLDECGAEYELAPIDFTKREHKSPEFLKINPAGKLPALVDGEAKVYEGAAICLYLADKYLSARYRQIAAPSYTFASPSTSAGSLPAGLIFKNSGLLCSRLVKSIGASSYSAPHSSSIHFAMRARLCGLK